MCGRYTHRLTWEEVHDLLRLTSPARAPDDWKTSFNGAPTDVMPVVRLDREGRRELAMLRWGLIPYWAKDEKIGYSTINARGEEVATKPAFKEAFRRRRCLVPADGFYEWKKLDAKTKQPYRITLGNGGPFAFAELWDRWTRGPEPIETFTIVTTEPNELVAPIHNCMPVIIDPADYNELHMYVTLTVEGARPEEIARGLAAAQAAFDRAGVTPNRAADARFNVEGSDIRGFDDDISGDDLAICTLWDEAEEAAIEACCAGWSARPATAYLKLVDPDRVPSGMAPENVSSVFMARKREIARELRIALEGLGAPFALLAAVGRWGDDADDESVLADLRKFNQTDAPAHARETGPQIIREIYIALENLGASPELLGEIGSWGDGEDDVDVLHGLRLFNRTGSIFTDVDIDLRADGD